MSTRREDSQDQAIVRLAAHLPDLIVYGDFSPDRPSVDYFDGVLMFVDISGFTAMTEKFSTAMYMDRGAEQLVEILNHYISAIVEKVLIFGGDILKFAGDALLALWKVERRHLRSIITVVIKCSLEIQGFFESQESAEGLDVRVKIGLAAGHITMVVFGDETRNYFLVMGQMVEDVRHAQSIAQMNDVILSLNCWQLCDQSMIEIERIPDHRAVKVNFLKPPSNFDFDQFFTKCMTFMDHYPSGDHKNLLRLTYIMDSNPELELSLQKYVMESILKQIDDKQFQGYLSELRPVTIMFVNLVFNKGEKVEVIASAIQDVCVHTSSVLKVFRGQINKIFMFDKGCSFLCVFGFPGEKAPDEATRALESAVEIFDFCSQVHKIQTVSIGVTSGTSFCGIVGHSVRHEYTVIGQKVNMAARMMMYYPGIVTCDSVTYNSRNLPTYFFKELPKRVMKGIADPEPIYQCLGLNEKIMFGMAYLKCNREEGYPLLGVQNGPPAVTNPAKKEEPAHDSHGSHGKAKVPMIVGWVLDFRLPITCKKKKCQGCDQGRDKEIRYFTCRMKEFLVSNRSQVLMYEGLPGHGKSQLLMEIDYLAQGENHRTIAIALTKISFGQNFYTIQMFMANVLGLETCKHYKERETNLQNKIKTLLDEKFQCLLNDIFYVQFPVSQEVSEMTTWRKQKLLETLFMKILEQTVKEERIIFIIDEAHFIDSASWSFMERLIRTVPIFIIMSLSRFMDIPCPAASTIMKNRNTTYITLGALQPKDILNKVCRDLNVKGIPKELDTYLVEGSCGIPLHCEELLKSLEHHRALVLQPMEVVKKTNTTWNNVNMNFSRPREELDTFTLSSAEENEEVCNLASGVILKNLSPPASLKEISLVQLDSMSPSHQVLVRCAAIIGLTFTTELLFDLLPGWDMQMMIMALATLVKSNIFHCFRNGIELRMALKQNVASFEVNPVSEALRGIALSEEEELRELAEDVVECDIIRFCRPVMQKTAYELWLKDQKKALHLKCACFLEANAHRCDHCRSGDFIPYHHFMVNIQLHTLDLHAIKKMAKSCGFTTEEEITFSKTEIPKQCELFPENLSPEEIREKILSFFDVIITKMRTSKEDIIPLESCQCEEILEMAIMPLADHFVALGEKDKALYYFLEITSAYLILGDNYKAYMYLNEAERLLKTLKKNKSWSHTFESATFYSLKGQVCFNAGQMVLAKEMLQKALRLLNRNFPCSLISLFLQTEVEKNRHFHFLNQQAQESSPPGERRLAQLCQQMACFSLLWKIYSLNYFFHYKYYSRLAAMTQVNIALETQDDFQIIKAYLDYSLHHQLAGYEGVWFKYEIMAMEQIFSLPLKGEGIEIMSYVADKLGYTKLLMGHLDLAIDLGSRAHKMWALLRSPNRQCIVLCWLSKALFLKDRHERLIHVLGRLWDLSESEEHIFSKAFFYFVCLDIMLYSGFVYKTFEECLEFIYQNEDNSTVKFQSGILLGLYSSVAIWYARLQEWDSFHLFSSRAENLVSRRAPTALYHEGISRYMEGQVLYLQKQIEGRAENAEDRGVQLLKDLESLVAQNTTGPVFYPRLYHLMAYVCILMGEGQNCDLFLNTALQLSETQGNVLEKCWLNMNKETWYSNSEVTEDQWLQTVLNLPSWEKIVSRKVNIQDINKNKFLMRVSMPENWDYP